MTPSLDAEQQLPPSAGVTLSSSFALLYQGLHETLVESVKEARSLVEESCHQPRSIATLSQLLHQIGGALRLAELKGGIELVDEIDAVVCAANSEGFDSQRATLLLDALDTLLRYLDCLHAGRKPLPALLLNAINRVRVASRRPPLPDSCFDLGHFRPSHPLPEFGVAKTQPIDSQKRLRQLYQVGLTNLLREQNVEQSLVWMAHALDRLAPGGSNPWRTTLWRLGNTLLRRFALDKRVPDDGGKRLFSALDRQIRLQIEQSDETALIETLRALITEFVYLLRLDRSSDDAIDQWLTLIAAPELDHSERDLLVGRLHLDGEDQRTLDAVCGSLLNELQSLRRYLEGLAIAAPFRREVVSSFVDQFRELNGALHAGNLRVPVEEGLRLQQALLEWLESGTDAPPTEAQLKQVAEQVVALEQRLIGFRHDDSAAGQQPPLLREARQALAQEAQANLAICKQAIESYLSSRERLHLANLAEVLDSVRGAALFLERSELIELIERVLQFITLLPAHDGKNLLAEVEALADTLIILEFLFGTPVDQPLDAALFQLARVTAMTLS